MKSMNYFFETVGNVKVVFYMLATAYKNLMWPMVVIGVPIVFFSFKGSLFEQVVFFLLLTLVFLIPYSLACLLAQYFSLNTPDKRKSFFSLDEKQKGHVLGDKLSGWW